MRCQVTKRAALIATAALSITAAGLSLISSHEGDGPQAVKDGQAVSVAYADPAHGWAVPTICKGHTLGVYRGQTATPAQCEEWLREDAGIAGRAIKRCTPVKMTQGQYNSLDSFVLNTGGQNYCNSALARNINAGDCYAAAKQFNAAPQIDRLTTRARIWQGRPIIDRQTGAVLLATGAPIMKWTTANGIPLAGLIKRRAAERAMFEADCDVWPAQKSK